jgi:hypothetical protein
MNDYLLKIINEEVERALVLKERVQLPLRFGELNGLATRCRLLLDDRISLLRMCSEDLQDADSDEKSVWRYVRGATRDIEWIEKYGLPPLYYPSNEVGFLNKMMFKMVEEIRLPLEPPAVAPFSTKYYYMAPMVNVIFVPLSEPDFFAHLPDLYHELGHYVSQNMLSELSDSRLKPLAEKYQQSFTSITNHYNSLLVKMQRESEFQDILYLIRLIHSNWKNWIEEFFGDIFATAVLGPAYAWSHLHLSTKLSENIYRLSKVLEETHPSNESRLRMLCYVLNELGFQEDARTVSRKWMEIMMDVWGKPSPEYQYAYPDTLLQNLAKSIIAGMRNCEIAVSSSKTSFITDGSDVRGLMNAAWKNFWDLKPPEYRDWEKQSIKGLRVRLGAS